MSRAVEWYEFTGLSGDSDDVVGVGGVYKQSILALAYCEMGGLVQLVGNQLKLLACHPHQHVAPVILMGERPHGRTEDVILAARGACKKPSPAQGLREPEGAAAIDLEEFGQIP